MSSSKETGSHQGEGMSNPEKESLQPVLDILKETLTKFNSLDEEAEELLRQQDGQGHIDKLRERAQLLVDLPDRLAMLLPAISEKTRKTVTEAVEVFAQRAQEALDKESSFALGVLLFSMGGKEGDLNWLEELIADLAK